MDPRITEHRNPRTARLDLATPDEIVELMNAEDRFREPRLAGFGLACAPGVQDQVSAPGTSFSLTLAPDTRNLTPTLPAGASQSRKRKSHDPGRAL
jgi:hypothetical protein